MTSYLDDDRTVPRCVTVILMLSDSFSCHLLHQLLHIVSVSKPVYALAELSCAGLPNVWGREICEAV